MSAKKSDPSKVRITITIDSDWAEVAERLAAEKGITRAEILAEFVKEKIEDWRFAESNIKPGTFFERGTSYYRTKSGIRSLRRATNMRLTSFGWQMLPEDLQREVEPDNKAFDTVPAWFYEKQFSELDEGQPMEDGKWFFEHEGQKHNHDYLVGLRKRVREYSE